MRTFTSLPFCLFLVGSVPALLLGCSSGSSGGTSDSGSTSSAGDGGAKKGGDASKDAKKEGGPIKGKPKPQDGGAIPDASADALKHRGDGSQDGSTHDGTTDGTSPSGDSSQPGDSGSDAGMGCTYSVTGAAEDISGNCIVNAAYKPGDGISFTLENLSSTDALAIAATISTGNALTPGTYTQSSGPLAGGTYQVVAQDMQSPPAGSYAMCWGTSMCSTYVMSGPSMEYSSAGSLSIVIDKPGPELAPQGDGGAALWAAPCGTLTAVIPPQMGTPSSGAANVTAKFCGTSIPMVDAGSFDAGKKDGGGATGACKITLSGPVNGTMGCTPESETYITSENTTALSFASTKPDGGPLAAFNIALAVILPGQAQTTTYTTTSLTPLCTGSAMCQVTASVSDSAADAMGSWQEKWTPTGGTANAGTWSVMVNQLGAQDPLPGGTGYFYVGLHGVYTGTLPLDMGDAKGTETVTVSF